MCDASWTTTTIAEIADPASRSIAIGPFGSSLKAEIYSQTGMPVVRGQDITDMKELSAVGRVYVPEAVAERFPACVVRAGDLVFPHRGAIGRVGIIGSQDMLLSSSMMKLTVNRSIVDPVFVLYFFRGPGRDDLLARASTVGTPGIGQPLRSLRSIPISFPCLSQQRAIAEMLGALDDKISTNAHAVAITAQVVRALLLKESIGGVRALVSEVAVSITRGVAPKYVVDVGLIVLNQKCVRDHQVDLRQARTTNPAGARQDRKLMRDDILVNSTGQGTLGRIARWTSDSIEATIDSHITLVRFDESLVDPSCAGVAMLEMEGQIEALAEGSTGQTELRKDLLGAIELRLPAPEVQRELGLKIREFDNLVTVWKAESERLTATRDELLPLLMSGKIRVREAERVVSEVV